MSELIFYNSYDIFCNGANQKKLDNNSIFDVIPFQSIESGIEVLLLNKNVEFTFEFVSIIGVLASDTFTFEYLWILQISPLGLGKNLEENSSKLT